MLAKNHACTDESDFADTLKQGATEANELSDVSANADQYLDFHHCGQEIENVVVLSIN